MPEDRVFIGTGHNPDGPDLPLGFGMQLAQVPGAIETYAKLPNDRKEAVIRYVKSGETGEEAKHRVMTAVQKLGEGNTGFF